MEDQLNCDAVIKKLAEAEQIIEALRSESIDAVIGEKNILILQLKETHDELKRQRDNLEQLVQEHSWLVEDLNNRRLEMERYIEELYQTRREAQGAKDKCVDLYDYAPVSYLTLGKNGVIVEANLTAAKLLGIEKKELGQFRFTDFIEPDYQDTFHSCVNQTFETSLNQKCEVQMHKKDGSVFFALLESIVKRISDGNSEHIRTIVTDITERKKAEEALKESEDRFKTIFAESTVGIELYDPDGRLINVNKAGLDIFGTTEDEVKEFNLFEDPNVTEEVKSRLRRGETVKYEAPFDFEKVRKYNLYPTSKTGVIELDVSITPLLRIRVGQPYGYLVQVQDITERKKAEERYKTVVRTTMDGFWLADIKGHFLDVNDSYCELIGYSRAELLKMGITDVEAAETSEETVSHLRKIMAIGQDRFETRHRRKDGQVVDIEVSVNFMDIEGGRFFVFLRDITERKRTEQALKESEERFLKAFHSSPAATNISRIEDGTIIEVNENYERLFGYNRHELIGRKTTELNIYINPQDRQELVNILFTRERVQNKELTMRNRQGKFINVLFSFEMVHIAGQDVALATIVDITERRQAEMDLQESEEKFRTLFSSMSEGFALHEIILDVEGKPYDYRFLELNDAFERLTGLSRDRVIGRTVKEILPDIESYWIENYGNVALTGKSFRFEGYSSPLRKWYEAYAYSPKRNRFAVVFVDITERKQAEESLRRYARELEGANNDLQQFAYITSHDLREPLRIITGFAQSLEKRYKDKLDKRANEYIDFIVDAAARMQNLIDDILAYSRVGTQGVPSEPVEMEKCIQNALVNLKMSIDETRAKITHDPLPVIRADPNQMMQVLQNLISNAIKFRRPEESPAIHVSAQREDEEWVFSVRDNGIGIAPELYGRLFVLFSRLHTQEEYPGTGVGLAIAKRIIQRHGGRIWVESQPGKGAVFYFSIPI